MKAGRTRAGHSEKKSQEAKDTFLSSSSLGLGLGIMIKIFPLLIILDNEQEQGHELVTFSFYSYLTSFSVITTAQLIEHYLKNRPPDHEIIGFVNFCQNKMEVIEINLDKESKFVFNFN